MKFNVHINKYEHILALCYHNNKIINVNFITFNVLSRASVTSILKCFRTVFNAFMCVTAIIKHFNGYRKYSGHWIKKRKGNEDEIYESFNEKLLKSTKKQKKLFVITALHIRS
uniref:Uncharacterized protein n=1 Tax=Glossina palpalis gambiensis TaxID=67801 RepID=A0A1B0C5R9_9MUSC